MEILIDNGANLTALDKMKRSPLECAVRYNRIDAVKILLENHVNVNVKNKHGSTSLHQAAEGGNIELINLLLQFKADVNAVTDSRRTPLHYAAQKGHTDILSILLEHSADVNAKETKLRETALHRAAASGSGESVGILLEFKADLHALNQDRRTPLHKAAVAGNIDTVTRLIQHGSATGLKDKNGKTPLESATSSSTRAAFERSVKEKSDISKTTVIKGEKKKEKKIERDPVLSLSSAKEIERDNEKDILHLKSVFQAISKASEDTENVITQITKRHTELIFRENENNSSKQYLEMREKVEGELKKLHLNLSEIAQRINASQDAMERCIFSSSDSNLDSTYDSTADWEIDTVDEDVQSYDKIDQIANFSDSEDISIKKESKDTKPLIPVTESPIKTHKRKKSMTDAEPKKKSNKSKRMKRSKSARKMKLSEPVKSASSEVKKKTSIKVATGNLSKSNEVINILDKEELNQMDKEQLIELAMKIRNTDEDNSTQKSKSVSIRSSDSGMNKKLKHRIPSKTRLRIAPLG